MAPTAASFEAADEEVPLAAVDEATRRGMDIPRGGIEIPDSLQIVPITFDELYEAQLEEVRVQEVFV